MRFLFSLPSRRLSYVKIVQGERNEKKKKLYNNIAFNDMYKLQFICLIGGTRPNLGATRPRVGIANLGLDAPNW